MTTKTDQTSKFADHLERSLDLVFEVKADTGAISSDLPGSSSFTDAAAGQIAIDLSELGEVEKVLDSEVVSESAGTSTLTPSITSDLLSLALDSDQDLSAGAVDFVIRVRLLRRR